MSAGGSRESSQNTSSSESVALRDALGFQTSRSFVDQSQQPFLDSLRQQALDRQSGFDVLRPELRQSAMAGQTALDNLVGLGNQQAVIDAQLSSLQSGLSDIFSQGLNSIRGDAYLSGAGGGARQDLAQAAFAGEIAQSFSQGVGDIFAGANQRAIAANQAAAGAVNPVLAAQTNAEFADLGALQGLLGSPTVLNQSFGADASQSTAVSTSEGQGSGQGSRASVGFK